MFTSAPLAFLVSLVAALVHGLKGYAVAGLVISGLWCGVFLLPMPFVLIDRLLGY